MDKPNNLVKVPTTLGIDLFKKWFVFLKPFHNLTDREIDVIACFVKERYELSKSIKDNDILEKVVFSEDTKQKVREMCNIKKAHFQVVLGNLSKSKLIVNGKFNPKFLPNLNKDSNYFQLLLLFELKENE